MKAYLLAAATAVVIGATPASAALNLQGSGSGSVSTQNTGATSTLTYGADAFSGSWELSGIASETGTKTFNFDSSGFYSYFLVRAAASAFSGSTETTLYSTGPAVCCDAPSGGFNYTGNVTLNLVAGEAYGFRLSGSHSDSANRLQGTFAVTDPTAAVPEPATWAMMLVGFGGIGFAMRRRKSKVTTTVAYA